MLNAQVPGDVVFERLYHGAVVGQPLVVQDAADPRQECVAVAEVGPPDVQGRLECRGRAVDGEVGGVRICLVATGRLLLGVGYRGISRTRLDTGLLRTYVTSVAVWLCFRGYRDQ